MSKPQPTSNSRTILFMVALSFTCALILSIIASILAKPQEVARNLDRSKQMMVAAHLLSYNGHFLIKNEEGDYIPAKFTTGGYLVAGEPDEIATSDQIIEVYHKRLTPMLVDHDGNVTTFADAKLDMESYLNDYKKIGYYKLPLMLIYKLLPNSKEEIDPLKATAEGWVIPVNGFGLWDAIYGYLAIAPNGNDVIGITWYDQKETPGLGANISEEEWQSQFPGKLVFQENSDSQTDFATAPLGITVVKGKVSEVYSESPKAKSAVDGMAGATLTGNGVTAAYKSTLAPYRSFLIKIHKQTEDQ